MAMARAEKRADGPRRPSTLAVPASRPRPRGGSTPRVRPVGPGAGEGPPPWTGSAARRSSRAGAEVHATATGSGPKRRCAPTRSRPPGEPPRPPGPAAPVLVP